jgi:expansin
MGGTLTGSGGTVAQGGTGTGGSGQGGSGVGGAARGGSGQGGSGQGGAARGGSGQGGSGQGGAARGGSGQGGSGVGGDTNTTCDLSGSPSPGSAAFTWYTLTQGSYVENGHYQVACGYHGQGQGQSPDVVQNIADSGHFVAIPGQDSSNFENVKYCGACVELQGQNGSKVIATVIDECPISSNPICQRSGALDISKTAFDKLGFSVGDPSGTTWKFVPCPVTGNIKVRIKPGNPNMIFIENTVLAIKSVSMNGQQASRTSYGCWQFGGNINGGASLELTDMADRKVTVTVSNTTADQDQDTGKQLPACK